MAYKKYSSKRRSKNKSNVSKSICVIIAIVIILSGLGYFYYPNILQYFAINNQNSQPLSTSVDKAKGNSAETANHNKSNAENDNVSLIIKNLYHDESFYTKVDVNISFDKISVDGKTSARTLNDQALALIKNENYYDAITDLLQANKEDPSDSEILGNLGYAYQQTGDYKKSNFVLLKALELKPERSSSWFSLAQNYAELGNITAAHMAYKNTLKYSRNRDKTITAFEKESERSENRAKALEGLMKY